MSDGWKIQAGPFRTKRKIIQHLLGKHGFQKSLSKAPNRQGIKHDAPKRSNQLASVPLLHSARRFSNDGTLMSRLHLDSELRLIMGWATRSTGVTASGPPDSTLGLVCKMSGGACGWSASYARSVASVFKWAGCSSPACMNLTSRAPPPRCTASQNPFPLKPPHRFAPPYTTRAVWGRSSEPLFLLAHISDVFCLLFFSLCPHLLHPARCCQGDRAAGEAAGVGRRPRPQASVSEEGPPERVLHGHQRGELSASPSSFCGSHSCSSLLFLFCFPLTFAAARRCALLRRTSPSIIMPRGWHVSTKWSCCSFVLSVALSVTSVSSPRCRITAVHV